MISGLQNSVGSKAPWFTAAGGANSALKNVGTSLGGAVGGDLWDWITKQFGGSSGTSPGYGGVFEENYPGDGNSSIPDFPYDEIDGWFPQAGE